MLKTTMKAKVNNSSLQKFGVMRFRLSSSSETQAYRGIYFNQYTGSPYADVEITMVAGNLYDQSGNIIHAQGTTFTNKTNLGGTWYIGINEETIIDVKNYWGIGGLTSMVTGATLNGQTINIRSFGYCPTLSGVDGAWSDMTGDIEELAVLLHSNRDFEHQYLGYCRINVRSAQIHFHGVRVYGTTNYWIHMATDSLYISNSATANTDVKATYDFTSKSWTYTA